MLLSGHRSFAGPGELHRPREPLWLLSRWPGDLSGRWGTDTLPAIGRRRPAKADGVSEPSRLRPTTRETGSATSH